MAASLQTWGAPSVSAARSTTFDGDFFWEPHSPSQSYAFPGSPLRPGQTPELGKRSSSARVVAGGCRAGAREGGASDMGRALCRRKGGAGSCVVVAPPQRAQCCRGQGCVPEGAAMASSSGAGKPSGSANEAPEIPDNVGDWLRGVYRFATDRNDFRRNLILNLGLFAAGVWLARNLSDIDLMAPQPGV